MGATLIDGKQMAADIRAELREKITRLSGAGKRVPCLAVVLVGEDPASAIYVRNKQRACEDAGIRSDTRTLPQDTTGEQLLELIGELNADADTDGILVQLPLPPQINANRIIEAIDPLKDVDGFHPQNAGALLLGTEGFVPCTPLGVVTMLHRTGIACEGKRCVIVGRSNIVGKPMALLMLREHATVTIAHSRTHSLPALCREADILIAAAGRPEMITDEYVREGAVVIDVGIGHREADGKLCGDVAFDVVSKKASFLTPVPGGVGPMTIAMLLQNTLTAYERRKAL